MTSIQSPNRGTQKSRAHSVSKTSNNKQQYSNRIGRDRRNDSIQTSTTNKPDKLFGELSGKHGFVWHAHSLSSVGRDKGGNYIFFLFYALPSPKSLVHSLHPG